MEKEKQNSELDRLQKYIPIENMLMKIKTRHSSMPPGIFIREGMISKKIVQLKKVVLKCERNDESPELIKYELIELAALCCMFIEHVDEKIEELKK